MISTSEAPYQSCYCEENVYKLFEKIRDSEEGGNSKLDEFWAVLISNDKKMIPLWAQKAAREPGLFVLWDYHVIAISKSPSESSSRVYDLDSVLEWGVDFKKYWEETMNEEEMRQVHTKYRRKFRLIPAPIYLRLLSSDRSHMLDANGKYLKPPPPWPKILQESAGNVSNLMDLINMSLEFPDTRVVKEKEMEEFFGK